MKQQLIWKWCTGLIALVCGFLTYLSVGNPVTAQQPITSGFSYSQNFNGIGTNAIATLPTNWRVDKQSAALTMGTWSAAVSATEQRAGNNMSSTAGNGIYNYAAGDPTSAADRAIGWISSGTGTGSGNLYLYLRNDAPINNLGSLRVAYDVEKYRNGSNPAGYRIQLYYSYNGSTWTTAGASFLTSFTANADNTGFASAPGSTVAVNNTLTFVSPIPPGGDLYLAWNYSVASGTTTSNAQGLGIDNVLISDPRQPNAVQVTNLFARSTDSTLLFPLTALGSTGLIGVWLILRRRSRTA